MRIQPEYERGRYVSCPSARDRDRELLQLKTNRSIRALRSFEVAWSKTLHEPFLKMGTRSSLRFLAFGVEPAQPARLVAARSSMIGDPGRRAQSSACRKRSSADTVCSRRVPRGESSPAYEASDDIHCSLSPLRKFVSLVIEQAVRRLPGEKEHSSTCSENTDFCTKHVRANFIQRSNGRVEPVTNLSSAGSVLQPFDAASPGVPDR